MFKYNTAICLLCKNENDYINEWLEYHINIGIEHFYIYDNMSDVPIKNSINSDFIDKCTIKEWDLTVEEYGNIQILCYDNCLHFFKNEAKWIAFIDADEFIDIKSKLNINEFLEQYDSYDGLYVDWVTYNANGKIKKEDKPVRERFTTTCPYYKDVRGKCIVKSREIFGMSPHFPIMPKNVNVIVDSDCNRVYTPISKGLVPIDKITINHYITKSYEEWCNKIKRGSSVPEFERKINEFFYFNPEMKEVIKNVE